MDIFYRSIQERETDRLTISDYLWRWDTDWFWCSRAFGAQNPKVRLVAEKRLLRSSFYWKLIAYDHRWNIGDKKTQRPQGPAAERAGGAGHRGPHREHRRLRRMVPGERPHRTHLALPPPALVRRAVVFLIID